MVLDEHILVVDDDLSVRRYVARVLRDEGYAVHEAGDGGEAEEFLDQPPPAVDLLLSDVVMPRLNGVELLERVSVKHPRLPCILMSGYANTQLVDLGIASPCAILAKPFSAEALIEEVRRCLPSKSD